MDGRRLAELLGPVGLWSFEFDRLRAPEAERAIAEIERLGYPVLWIPEGSASKDALTHSGLLLSMGTRLVVGTGVANIWARDPVVALSGSHLLADAYPGRFVLGLGVSHPESLPRRGHTFASPIARMRAYLEAMDSARYAGPVPERPAPRVLGALGPRMLRLAAERAAGAHTYFVPVEHTARARAALGRGPALIVEQAAVIETDAAGARRTARRHMSRYMGLVNYRSNLLRLGFTESDLEGEGSERLVDALVVCGTPGAVAARVRAHLDAGADHVAVQVLPRSKEFSTAELEPIAGALGV